MALVVTFHAGGTTNRGDIIAPANTHPNPMLTLKIEREARASRTVASLPWRRPWRPRFQREGKKEICPHQGAIEAINTSWWWREVRRSYGRDGGGGGATQCTRDDGGTARRCGSSAAALWAKEEARKLKMGAGWLGQALAGLMARVGLPWPWWAGRW